MESTNYSEKCIKKEGKQEQNNYFFGIIQTLKHYEKESE